MNIGLLIEQRMNEVGMTKAELAQRLGIASQNVNRLFAKEGMDTNKLMEISKALDYDFFSVFRPVAEVKAEADDHSIHADGAQSAVATDGGIVATRSAVALGGDASNITYGAADGDGRASAERKLYQRLLDEKDRRIEEKERYIQLLLSELGKKSK